MTEKDHDSLKSTSETSEREIQENVKASLEGLLQRCNNLLKELENFRNYARDKKQESRVELRHFNSSVRTEAKSLAKLSHSEPSLERVQHVLRSTNIPFYETVWRTARQSKGVIAFHKRFSWAHTDASQRQPKRERFGGDQPDKLKSSALVDIVAEGGFEWVKVSLIPEQRLLFDLAKQGWERGQSDDDEDEDQQSIVSSGSDEDDVPLFRIAQGLAKARKMVRIRYRHPQVRFVLPKIVEGKIPQVDALLNDIRATGATVQCAGDLPDGQVEAGIQDMFTNDFERFSSVLNIDCTMLLALVSDLSHAHISAEAWFHTATRRQLEMEENENLLPSSVYPALGDRLMVCTHEAAKRMREIVSAIGTESEKARTKIVMGDKPGKSRQELIEEFQKHSEHPVPRDVQFPIVVVDRNVPGAQIPPVAQIIAKKLSDINQSVFLYGWASGHTTLSSNRTVVRTIETVFEENRSTEDEVGPDVWLCPVARSLVGKEKDRKEGSKPIVHKNWKKDVGSNLDAKYRARDAVGQCPKPKQ